MDQEDDMLPWPSHPSSASESLNDDYYYTGVCPPELPCAAENEVFVQQSISVHSPLQPSDLLVHFKSRWSFGEVLKTCYLQFSFVAFLDFFSLVLTAFVIDGQLVSWTRKFKELLESTLGWKFEKKDGVNGIYFKEDDEYAPTVVMMDD